MRGGGWDTAIPTRSCRTICGPTPVAGGASWQTTTGAWRVWTIRWDRAFCFYYEDNLNLLRELGAELVEFSPIADSELPAGLDGIDLGGGYPELHAEALSSNYRMKAAITGFVSTDRPVYAECGGFMYLTENIVDEGRE